MARDNARGAACYMAGILQAQYDNGEIGPMTVRNVNELLREANLEHVSIEL